ncbi:MAG: acyl-CoA dehydrogenase family protein [Pseudomonadota bacterium]
MDFAFTEEQLMFKDSVLRFAQREIVPRVREHDLAGEFDFQAFRKLGEFGILGLHLPEELGGAGADVVTTVMAGEALGEAGVDGGLNLAYGAHTFLCADTIFKHGNEDQQKRVIPKLASGEWIGCMGLTEPSAGSDAAAIRTKAEKTDAGWVLNGSKIFITNGPIADVALVYARTGPGEGHQGLSAFVVEKGTPGFRAGKNLHKMGVRTSQTSELFFDDCEVPDENLIGRRGMGFLMALQTVEWDRCALMAPFIGAMAAGLKRSAIYATERKQFGVPIADYPAIKEKLARMKIFVEAARPLCYRIAWCKDQGKPLNHLEAAVAKLFIGDWSLGPANDAVMVHGGYGYCHEYDVERIFRDGRLAPIGGGTSEIQKRIIAKLI